MQGAVGVSQVGHDIQASVGAVREAVVSAMVTALQVVVVVRVWAVVLMGWEAAEMEVVAAMKVWAKAMKEGKVTEEEAVALVAAAVVGILRHIDLDKRLARSCLRTVLRPNARCSGHPAAHSRPREERGKRVRAEKAVEKEMVASGGRGLAGSRRLGVSEGGM